MTHRISFLTSPHSGLRARVTCQVTCTVISVFCLRIFSILWQLLGNVVFLEYQRKIGIKPYLFTQLLKGTLFYCSVAIDYVMHWVIQDCQAALLSFSQDKFCLKELPSRISIKNKLWKKSKKLSCYSGLSSFSLHPHPFHILSWTAQQLDKLSLCSSKACFWK